MTTLIIECEGAAPARVELPPGEYSLGADNSNTIVIDHPTVSRHHCNLLIQSDGRVLLLDAGSTNGTWLAGEPVDKATISPGQSFQTGAASITVGDALGIPLPSRVPITVPRPTVVAAPSNAASAMPAPSRSFFQELPDACIYPIRGEAYLYIVMVVVLELVSELVPNFLGIVGWIIAIAVGCYLLQLWREIIHSTIDGKDTFPVFPNMSLDFQENLSLYLRYVVLIWICFSPGILYSYGKMWYASLPPWVLTFCYGFSFLFFPMSLLAFMITDSFAVLNPVFIFRSIFKILSDYLLLASLFALIIGGGYLSSLIVEPTTHAGQSSLPRALVLLVSTVTGAMGLYCFFVWTRLLGLFYRHHKDRLDWV